MSVFNLAITAVSGTRYDLSHATGVRFSTQLPGGCAELTCRMPGESGDPPAVPPYLGYNYRVDLIEAGYGYLWSGRMNYPKLVRDASGYHWVISAKGYGVSLSDQFSTTTNARNTVTSTLISNALSALAPDIDKTTITATGFTISNTTAVNLKRVTPAMMIAWANRFGDSSYNPQLMYVYPDATDGAIRFTYGPRATAPDVLGRLSDADSAEIGGDESEYANKITVQYNSGTAYVSVSDTAESTKISLVKEYAAVIPEITQSVDATQAANAILAVKKSLRIAASGPLVYRSTAPLWNTRSTDPFGTGLIVNSMELLPVHRIRSGQLFRFLDVSPHQSAASNLTFLNSFMVAGTDYDEDNQILRIMPESQNLHLERSIATVYQLLAGRYQIS